MTAGCETETETEIWNNAASAKLFYTPDCATINGYITLDDSNKTYVFQHDVDEEYHVSGIDVYVEYEIRKEPIPLTAECTQADVITITFLQKR